MKKARKFNARRSDPKNSEWGTSLEDPELKNVGSKAERLFRRRFRVPYDLFQEIMQEMRNSKAFDKDDAGADVTGEKSISLELKVVGALRILARSSTFDEIRELSGISIQTMSSFFKKFVAFLLFTILDRF